MKNNSTLSNEKHIDETNICYEQNSQIISAVVIVTYNQTPDINRLLMIMNESKVNYLIVADNSDNNFVSDAIEKLVEPANFPKVILLRNEGNLGISKALNKAFKISESLMIDFFYILDDDAIISPDLFKTEMKVWLEKEASGVKLGIVCPIVSNDLDSLGAVFLKNEETSEIKFAINSGMLVSRLAIEQTGGYDESYFVEHADIKFSEKISEKSFKIVRINKVLIVQSFGKTLDKDTFFGWLYASIFRKWSSFTSFSCSICNDFVCMPRYYPPSREKRIYELSLKVITEKKIPRYKKFSNYFLSFCLNFTRQFLLFLIFKNTDYIKGILP